MQMPGQPPAERQRGQQRSSLMGRKHRVTMTWEKAGVDTGPVSGKGHRTGSSDLSFPKCSREMFHMARADYKLLSVANIYCFTEYLVVFLIGIQRI